MKRVVLLMGAWCLLFVLGASSAFSARGVTVFRDATGEVATGAPDIGKVTVTQANDVLTVEAAISGMPEILTPGSVGFLLNTDANASTGKYGGADYVLFTDWKTMQGSVLRWNGSRYVAAKKVADPSRTLVSGRGAGFMFNLANFGYPKQIGLATIVQAGESDSTLGDIAPNSGMWTFTVTPTMKTLDIGFTPTVPKAGSMFAASSSHLTLTDKTTVVPRSMVCTATLGGIKLLGKGIGKCRWMLPATARGKSLVISVKTTHNGETAEFGDWTFRVH